jgi:hypothetical protein
MAHIYRVIQRTENHDEEVAYRETEEDAEKEAAIRRSFNPTDIYLVLPKKIFGLNPEE